MLSEIDTVSGNVLIPVNSLVIESLILTVSVMDLITPFILVN